MLNLRRNQEIDVRSERRHSSNASKGSASNRFLKRKPDHKKIIEGIESKKKKEAQNYEYFNMQTSSTNKKEQINLSAMRSDSDKYLAQKVQLKNKAKPVNEFHTRSLQTAKSESNLLLRKRQKEIATLAICKEMDCSNKQFENDHHYASVITSQSDLYTSPYASAELFGVYSNKYGGKKSKTQKFIQEELQSQEIRSEINRNDDLYENQQNQTQKTKDYKLVQVQYESLTKKHKLIQQQLTIYKQKEQILKAEQEHLNQILIEKDRIIDRLTREKALLNEKIRNQPENKMKQIIEGLKIELRNQQQRILYLKEENTFLETELLARNEEITQIYKNYKQLQSSFKEYQLKMIEKIETMKTDFEKEKSKAKDEIIEIDSYGQIEKWKQKVITQQQQLKYLRIQNQCLLMSKDELQKVDLQNRKLKDERDYFKKKVLENAKRAKRILNQTSLSSSEVLLELSQCSLQK